MKCVAVGMAVAVASSCGGTVNYNPGTSSDATPPAVNLLIVRTGEPNLEVQEQTLPAPTPLVGNYGDPFPASLKEFSVLATATDNESGIRSMKLTMTRTVCYESSGGGITQAYSGTVTRKTVTYPQQSAPQQASLGDTGVLDGSVDGAQQPDSKNLLVWTNANGARRVGVGVSTKWNMEAVNQAGRTVYSNSIRVLAGNTICVTSP